MERLVSHITEQILEKLPEGKDFYTPEDLRSNGIYEFVVKRVEFEMNQKLRESVVPPESDWADMKTDRVEEQWEQFIEAIVEEVRMPASNAETVFETAVSDILDLLTRPRTTIPMLLFMEDDEMDRETLKKRSEMITVNTHLVDTLNRYMEKKKKVKIIRVECETVIERIDQRLVSNYNALNWAQLLEPLFQLYGPSVDTNLFRIFFEEKGMLRVSRKFDMMNSTLTKTEFIEALSVPYLLNVDEEDDSVSLFDVPAPKEPAKKADESKESAEKKVSEETSNTEKAAKEKDKEKETPADPPDLGDVRIPEPSKLSDNKKKTENQSKGPVKSDIDADNIEDSIIANFHKRREFTTPETDEDESPLHSKFMLDTDQKNNEEPEEPVKIKEKIGDISETLLNEKEIPDVEDEDFTFIIDEDSDGKSPMWKAFLERQEESSDDEDSEKNQQNDDKVVTASDDRTRSKEMLNTWLADEKSIFIKELFDGSESAFDKALVGLSECEDWKTASKFIEKEIFSRNSIDMYDEIAVDFTDRLHTYFTEFK